MKSVFAIFFGAVLLAGAAFAANDNIRGEDRERALAFARCNSMTGDAGAQCQREARANRGAESAKSGKQGYWSPQQMAQRAKGRIKKAAGAVERAVERKDKDSSAGK